MTKPIAFKASLLLCWAAATWATYTSAEQEQQSNGVDAVQHEPTIRSDSAPEPAPAPNFHLDDLKLMNDSAEIAAPAPPEEFSEDMAIDGHSHLLSIIRDQEDLIIHLEKKIHLLESQLNAKQ